MENQRQFITFRLDPAGQLNYSGDAKEEILKELIKLQNKYKSNGSNKSVNIFTVGLLLGSLALNAALIIDFVSKIANS